MITLWCIGPRQCVSVFGLTEVAHDRVFMSVSGSGPYRELTSPRGCEPEFEAVWLYLGSKFLWDPESLVLVVVCMELILHILDFEMFEAYDNCSSWVMSSNVLRFVRDMC